MLCCLPRGRSQCSARECRHSTWSSRATRSTSSYRGPSLYTVFARYPRRFTRLKVLHPAMPVSHGVLSRLLAWTVHSNMALTVAVPRPYGRGRWRFDSSMGRPSGPSPDGRLQHQGRFLSRTNARLRDHDSGEAGCPGGAAVAGPVDRLGVPPLSPSSQPSFPLSWMSSHRPHRPEPCPAEETRDTCT